MFQATAFRRLTWKAEEYDFITRFIELAEEINISMPYNGP